MNLLKTSLLKIKNFNKIQGTNTMKHFPVSTREWNNSLYVYNKYALNLIPVSSLSAAKIIKSYFALFNWNIEKKLRSRKFAIKRRKLSNNKIFIANNEFKHTNKKVVINLYLFNRQEKNYYISLKKKYNNWNKRNRYNSNKQKKYNLKNLRIYKLKKQNLYLWKKAILSSWKQLKIYSWKKRKLYSYIQKLYNLKLWKLNILKLSMLNYELKGIYWRKFTNSEFKKIQSIKKINLEYKKYLKIQEIKFSIRKFLPRYLKKQWYKQKFLLKRKQKSLLKRKLFQKSKLYLYYRQLIYINKSKYNYNYLQYLKKYLHIIFNKNIEFNIINLKRFYLNSDILSETIKLKLTKNRRRIKRHLYKLKNKVKTKEKNPFKQNTLNKFIVNNKIKIQKNIIKNIKYKDITGFRLEARGRLTRRHTASRSITKFNYKGNLLNHDSCILGLSTILLKGNLESNLQYTKLKSKTRIGSFGLKGWVSGN